MRKLHLKGILSGLAILLLFFGCSEQDNPNYRAAFQSPRYLHQSMNQLTDVIIHDIFSPPVASRIYAYPSIAAFEALASGHENYRSLVGQLNEMEAMPSLNPEEEYLHELAALEAFLQVGQALVFSEEKMEAYKTALYAEIDAIGIPQAVYDRSIAYGGEVAQAIIKWSGSDNYKETRSDPAYTFDEDQHTWKPTPPAYMQGIEPSWNRIRTFVLDSAQQFVPAPPTAFSLDKNSQFYEELIEVYDAVNNLDEERTEIASFWDCNPYVLEQKGHGMFAKKKITPGGHWMGIAGLASRKANADWMESAEAYAITSIALADGFISCWDEKWRSVLIRPETLINEYLDPDWEPLLQTPPFPEHTSGHSVISTAAATALTELYGDQFAFADSTEVNYGLPVRSYTSFMEASQEAAISRLYGGIHYMPAITEGVKQGAQVGEWVLNNIEIRQQIGQNE